MPPSSFPRCHHRGQTQREQMAPELRAAVRIQCSDSPTQHYSTLTLSHSVRGTNVLSGVFLIVLTVQAVHPGASSWNTPPQQHLHSSESSIFVAASPPRCRSQTADFSLFLTASSAQCLNHSAEGMNCVFTLFLPNVNVG